MKYCPFCDGQGVIYEAIVKKLDIKIYICDECDTVWKSKDIRENECQNFGEMMENSGLKGLWSELRDIKRI